MELRKKLGILAIIGTSGASALVSQAAWSSVPTQVAPKATALGFSSEMEKADWAFQERGNEARARQAHEIYRTLFDRDPKNPELGWRFAMASYFVGLRLTKEKSAKTRIFAQGRDAGKAAVTAAPNCAPCHFWTAINMALYGQTVGAVKTLFSLKDIRAHLKETVRLDPTYASAGAQRLLGLIEQKLPGVLGGSNDRAKAHFEEAITTSPDEPLNYLFLAKLLDDKFDEKEKAMTLAKRGQAIEVNDSSRIESMEARLALQEFVKTGKWKYN